MPRYEGRQGPAANIVTEPQITLPGFGPMRLVAIPRFRLQPTEGNLYQAMNPSFGVQGVLFDQRGLLWWSRYETNLPLTAGARRDGLITTPTTVQLVQYSFPNSPFVVRAVAVPMISFFRDGSTEGLLYLSPALWYRLNAKTKLTVVTEHVFFRDRGEMNVFGLNRRPGDPDHVMLGVRHDFSDKFWFQPLVNFLPQAPGSEFLKTAHLAFFFGGTFL